MAALDFPTSPSINDTYTANGKTWKWDGTSWIAQNTGEAGAQGIQGTQGIQGVQGSGTQGIQGTTGSQGTDGIQGTDGTQGIQGTQGTTGSQGIQGIQGTTGTQGTDGIQGIQGIQGTTGSQGIQGVQGTTGTQGIQGISVQGVQGTTGTQGTTGGSGPRTVSFLISGGGATITTGATEAAQTKGYVYTSQTLVVDSWTLLSNASGSIEVDIWTGTYGNFPTLVLASGTNSPRIDSASKNTGSNTGWAVTQINAGNAIQFRVNSNPTVTVSDVTVVMNVIATS